MRYPESFSVGTNCDLLKAICGTGRAPRRFNKKLSDTAKYEDNKVVSKCQRSVCVLLQSPTTFSGFDFTLMTQ